MTEGIWLPTSFPPEAEGVYQRRKGTATGEYVWDGHEWRCWKGGVSSIVQDGEYFSPEGFWAVTKGVRPPLAEGTMVECRTSDDAHEWHCNERFIAWHGQQAFRLAPALKPKCEHVWSASGHACDTCGANRQSYEATFVKRNAAQKVPDTARIGTGSTPADPGVPVITPPAAAPDQQCFYCKRWFPFPVAYHHDEKDCVPTPRRDRFGLKWPAEPRSRTVLGTAHATYFKEWK